MSASVSLQDSLVIPPSAELNEAAWSAWQMRHAASDRKQAGAIMLGVKCISLALLLLAVFFSGYAAPHHLWVRFVISLTAIVIACQAWDLKRYVFLLGFAAIAVIFNPVVPMFPIDAMVRSSVPSFAALAFVASIVWLRAERRLS